MAATPSRSGRPTQPATPTRQRRLGRSRVDATAPQTTIDSGRPPRSLPRRHNLASPLRPTATFECRLDAGAWTACSSPKGYSALPDGGHVFSVRATDPAGNTDPTPPTRGFSVDTSAPNGSGGPASTNPVPATTEPTDGLDAGGEPTPPAAPRRLPWPCPSARKLAAILAKGLRVTSTCSARVRKSRCRSDSTAGRRKSSSFSGLWASASAQRRAVRPTDSPSDSTRGSEGHSGDCPASPSRSSSQRATPRAAPPPDPKNPDAEALTDRPAPRPLPRS